ncbi:MAG: hypothetical protein IT384_24705 [Deltaproteobacteria bacterium]|nr:hypothetical protein [Deltaproteobacteria bacterium]
MNIAVTLGLLIFGVLVCVVARSEEPPEVILASLPPRITMTAAGMIAPRLLMEHATIRLDTVFACAAAAAFVYLEFDLANAKRRPDWSRHFIAILFAIVFLQATIDLATGVLIEQIQDILSKPPLATIGLSRGFLYLARIILPCTLGAAFALWSAYRLPRLLKRLRTRPKRGMDIDRLARRC